MIKLNGWPRTKWPSLLAAQVLRVNEDRLDVKVIECPHLDGGDSNFASCFTGAWDGRGPKLDCIDAALTFMIREIDDPSYVSFLHNRFDRSNNRHNLSG
jgi:hypothetical protein